MAGSIFSATGRDIGAAFSGAEPVTAFLMGQGGAVTSSEEVLDTSIGEGSLNLGEIDKMEQGLAVIESEVFGQQSQVMPALSEEPSHSMTEVTAPEEPSVATANVDRAGDDDIDPAKVTRDAEAALSGFDDDEKEVLMRALVELLREVETDEEFKQAVYLWTNEIARRAKAYEEGAAVTSDIVEDVQQELNNLPPVSVAPDIEAEEATLAEQFLNDIRYESLWFGVGSPTAPAVYAFIDPTCPYCARAMANLKDEVEQGRMHLRVILSPALSDDSLRYIAGILTSENPPMAYWDHEIAKSRTGRSSLETADWDVLPVEVRTAIMGNMDLIKKYQITGVPFFGFNSDDGLKVVTGVPEVADFDGALPDDYTGNR